MICSELTQEKARKLKGKGGNGSNQHEQRLHDETFAHKAGNALIQIRDNRLYREKFGTFEEYCQNRWTLGRNYINKLITASEVVFNLGTIVPKPTNGRPRKRLHDETFFESVAAPMNLIDVGISKIQAYRWRQIAELPEPDFEATINDAKENGWELTTYDIKKTKQKRKEQKATAKATI